MTEKFAKKLYLTVLIIFMVLIIFAAVIMFVSPVIPLAGGLIYSGVALFIETLCIKYLLVLLKKE